MEADRKKSSSVYNLSSETIRKEKSKPKDALHMLSYVYSSRPMVAGRCFGTSSLKNVLSSILRTMYFLPAPVGSSHLLLYGGLRTGHKRCKNL